MRPVSPGAFRRLFDGLDARARRAFVADLYAARGWEVRTDDDDQLHVRRDGDERRVAIVEPPRFRAVTLPDADEVIVTRDRGGARSAAEEAGLTYRTPDDLRDLLLYGVDRERAAALFEEYFDRPLAADPTADSESVVTRLAALRPELTWNTRQVGVAVAILLVVAVWAGGAGLLPALGSEPAAPEVNGTYTPGAVGAVGGEAEYPPGLGPDGIENSGELAIAHLQFLGEQPHVYRISASGPQHAPFMLGLTQWNATVRVQDATTYRYRKEAVAPYGFRVEQRADNRTVWEPRRPPAVDNNSTQERLTKRVYANGTEKFWWFDGPGQEAYRRASVEQQGGRVLGITDQVGWVELYFQRFLWTPNSSIECVQRTEVQSCQTYRVEATGEPVELRSAVSDYRAVAIVEQPGFVRSLRVRYGIEPLDDEGGPLEVSFRLEYVDVGEKVDDVSPPEWLAEAKNRTADTGPTETPTGTANESRLPPP